MSVEQKITKVDKGLKNIGFFLISNLNVLKSLSNKYQQLQIA